ncbi:MAG: YigZ family protein [Clostridiales bacterium]|nr:YigZ family protein [Clostridiales bacterium]
MDEYRTVPAAARAEFIEKRSRFIGSIRPVTTEEEAVAFIEQRRTEFWDAKHNVYAYILRQGQIQRYSDDHEPKGTAGVPVLEVLRKEGVTDCAVVVTRYFGGVLLGAGGLVRAYSHGAKIALDAAGIAVMRLCAVCRLDCAYAQYSQAEAAVRQFGGVVEDTEFAAGVTICFYLPCDRLPALRAAVTDQFCGTLVVEQTGERYAASTAEEAES